LHRNSAFDVGNPAARAARSRGAAVDTGIGIGAP